MKNLKELVQVVSQNKVKRIELLNLRKHQTSKVNALYYLISDGAALSDDEAYETLYPTSKSRSAYNNLKSALRDKLINTLFFIDTSKGNYSDRQTAYFEAHKEYAAAQILLAKNAHNAAIDVLTKLLKKSNSFDFTELSWMTARMLRMEYSTRFGDQEKFDHFNEVVKKTAGDIELENKAEFCYGSLILNFVKNKSPKPELAKQAEQYVAELSPYLRYCKAYKYHFFTALIELFQYTCLNHYTKVIPICDRYLKFFQSKSYLAATPIQLLYQHKLVAYLQLGEYELADEVASLGQSLTEEGTFNWFNSLEYIFLLNMHTMRFDEAYNVFCQAVEHKRFKTLPSYIQELWDIYRAYLHLLVDAKMLKVKDNDRKFTSFRINKFLNDLNVYNKDKQGMNVAVLIVQILFYIQKERHDDCIDRIETTDKYINRYALEANASRSYHFIQLLLATAKASFQLSHIEETIQLHLTALKGSPAAFTSQFHKIEVVPYEVLWRITVKWLKNEG